MNRGLLHEVLAADSRWHWYSILGSILIYGLCLWFVLSWAGWLVVLACAAISGFLFRRWAVVIGPAFALAMLWGSINWYFFYNHLYNAAHAEAAFFMTSVQTLADASDGSPDNDRRFIESLSVLLDSARANVELRNPSNGDLLLSSVRGFRARRDSVEVVDTILISAPGLELKSIQVRYVKFVRPELLEAIEKSWSWSAADYRRDAAAWKRGKYYNRSPVLWSAFALFVLLAWAARNGWRHTERSAQQRIDSEKSKANQEVAEIKASLERTNSALKIALDDQAALAREKGPIQQRATSLADSLRVLREEKANAEQIAAKQGELGQVHARLDDVDARERANEETIRELNARIEASQRAQNRLQYAHDQLTKGKFLQSPAAKQRVADTLARINAIQGVLPDLEMRLKRLPPVYQGKADEILQLFEIMSDSTEQGYGPAFQSLWTEIEHLSTELLKARLPLPEIKKRDSWFSLADVGVIHDKDYHELNRLANDLELTLINAQSSNTGPVTVLIDCLYWAEKKTELRKQTGFSFFTDVRKQFKFAVGTQFCETLRSIRTFRNDHVGHHGRGKVFDSRTADAMMRSWLEVLVLLLESMPGSGGKTGVARNTEQHTIGPREVLKV